ncbi:hypothetical protein EDC01DRAFT_660224 [Geopyxis carbonaria]|nr:hypothetical protein EDC01DRAFT_660224 [Geopyxis carbonaria]
MAGTSEPTVALSFANNFWGKEDAGVGPMLQRMHDAKTTCEELKGFYSARNAIEDEYARKLLALSKKPLGSVESGSLKTSLDVLRLEVESMAKAHQNIAGQFKTECEEQLTAFSGAMRERRKIVQGGIEKLLKLKMQQTQTVNKTRDRYEQDCLKIKGYIAQGHMVMGQEEKKNKTRLEKAQIALTGSSAEYEAAIKALEDTTGRWNRDWKQACDKFQDLEEERIEFLKASCWMFANIQSTVCVSDDASCEKMRIALEECDIEKDIVTFITEKATGQEIPDAPKFMNFCRDYDDDEASEAAEENYTMAQFPRSGNPAFRSSSPNPSMASSHAAPESRSKPSRSSVEPEPEQAIVKKERRRRDRDRDGERRGSQDRRRKAIEGSNSPNDWAVVQPGTPSSRSKRDSAHMQQRESTPTRSQRNREAIQNTPHNEYPLDGMTMYCRPGHMASDGSSGSSPVQRPSSSQGGSDYSSPTTVSSSSDGSQQQVMTTPRDEDKQMKRKSGFFSGGGPFRRKSKSDKEQRQQQIQQQREMALQEQRLLEAHKQKEQAAVMARPSPKSRGTWSPSTTQRNTASPQTNGNAYGSSGGRLRQSQLMLGDERHDSPEPIDPHASVALNVGGNVFDVSRPDSSNNTQKPPLEEDPTMDPIAQALAELKGVTKNSVGRNSADRFFGLSTPAPSATPRPSTAVAAAQRGTPPPTYVPKTSALDLPPPAFTSAQMQQTTQRYTAQRDNLLEGPPQMPAARNESPSRQGSGRQRSKTIDYQRPQSRNSHDMTPREDPAARSVSPIPNRSVSPRPQIYGEAAYRNNSPKPRNDYSRSASPNPYTQSRPGTASSNRPGQYATYSGSPGGQEIALSNQYRNASPAPSHHSHHSRNDSYSSRSRAGSVHAGSVRDGYGSANNRQSFHGDSAGAVQMYQGGAGGQISRPRSKSQADNRFSRDGRPILRYARAMYQYQAAIPQELPFAKGDILAVLREQDDGWWEAEIVGVQGRPGLVPSNYLQNC